MLFGPAPAARVVLVTVLALGTSACAEAVRASVQSAAILADEDSTEPELIAAGVVIGVSAAAAVAALVALTVSGSADSRPARAAEYQTELGYGVMNEGGWVRWSRCVSLDVCTGEPRREPAVDVVSIEELGVTKAEPSDSSEGSEVVITRIRIRRFVEPRVPARSPSRSAPPI